LALEVCNEIELITIIERRYRGRILMHAKYEELFLFLSTAIHQKEFSDPID
jgi:hypothetical protein